MSLSKVEPEPRQKTKTKTIFDALSVTQEPPLEDAELARLCSQRHINRLKRNDSD